MIAMTMDDAHDDDELDRYVGSAAGAANVVVAVNR